MMKGNPLRSRTSGSAPSCLFSLEGNMARHNFVSANGLWPVNRLNGQWITRNMIWKMAMSGKRGMSKIVSEWATKLLKYLCPIGTFTKGDFNRAVF